MTVAPRRWAAELLHFWFHTLRPRDWFRSSERVDQAMQARFARDLAMLGPQPVGDFLTDRHTARAAILLFDQVPRNLFRGDPRAFAYDHKAVALSRAVITKGWHRGLTRHERQFIGMPFMHSEDIADQLAGLAFFADERLYGTWRFSRSHYRMIARFGRFPHRNDTLGRKTTDKEQRAIDAGFAW